MRSCSSVSLWKEGSGGRKKENEKVWIMIVGPSQSYWFSAVAFYWNHSMAFCLTKMHFPVHTLPGVSVLSHYPHMTILSVSVTTRSRFLYKNIKLQQVPVQLKLNPLLLILIHSTLFSASELSLLVSLQGKMVFAEKLCKALISMYCTEQKAHQTGLF